MAAEKKVETIETIRDGGVILEPAVKKQTCQYKYWCFTYNNYKVETLETIEQVLGAECQWYVFQEEKGDNQTPHLQGTLCLYKKQRLSELKRIDPAIHWEATRCVKASVEYCSKYKTRIGPIHTKGIELPDEIDLIEPYGWQNEVMTIINAPTDKRTIHWFWEHTGGVGKTTLCKYLVCKHNALMITGKSNDMYFAVKNNPTKRKLILVDVPRSTQDYINYGAIEQIKNGLVFSGKYESCQLVFNCPTVIVFANEPPDVLKMSNDRWNIREIVVEGMSL